MKQRGVYEKVPGSGVWWIVYFDQFGKRRREKRAVRTLPLSFMGNASSRCLRGRNSRSYFVSRR